jgi:hypothetical protein
MESRGGMWSTVLAGGGKVVAAFAVATLLAACHSRVLRYQAAHHLTVDQTRYKDVLLVSGGSIHSGLCVQSVEQLRQGDVITLVVKLELADLRCPGSFFALIRRDPNLREVRLGVPGSSAAGDLGVVWRKPAAH